MSSATTELLRLLKPPAEKWALPSLEAIERGYGSALPDDYMWLAETYGLGVISRTLSIFPPLGAGEIGTRSGVFPTAAEWSGFDKENEGLDPEYLKPGALLMWGFDHHDNYAFWRPVGDPAHWPIVIRRALPQSGPGWLRYDLGIVEFLVRTFHGRLPENPFAGDALWCNTSPTFERD